MRLLHTSDWHLGASMEDAPCEAEQERFLGWLSQTIRERQIDVLVVAGDIFHFRQPSNSALQLYFDFLVECDRHTELRQVVITGGNHDSPSGLEAPRELLGYLDVCVVGGLLADEQTWERCLVPVAGASGDIELVVAAVPYVPEVKLGISGVGQSTDEIRAQFRQAFARLYSRLADLAVQRHGDVALVTTGHLTCYGRDNEPDRGDFHTAIHQVGTIDYLPPSIFDERFSYVALGHIHRMMPIDEERIWYSGTPVPTSRTETGPRFVIEVDLDDGAVDIEKLRVPRWRPIRVLEGSADEVVDELGDYAYDSELAPYLFVHVRDEAHDYEHPPFQRLQAILEQFDAPRPRIVDYRETIIGDDATPTERPPDLDELSYEEVFCRMYRRTHGESEPDEELLRAFRELLVEPQDDDEPQYGDRAVQSELPMPQEAS